MKIAIIDDEKYQFDILKDTCTEYGNNNNIKIDTDYYEDGNMFLNHLNNLQYI